MGRVISFARIFTPVELNLGLRMVHANTWNDIPVFHGDKQLEQELVEGFLGLNEMGLVRQSERKSGHFDLTEEARALFLCIGEPDRKLKLHYQDKQFAMYCRGNHSVLICVTLPQLDECRVYNDERGKLLDRMFSALPYGRHAYKRIDNDVIDLYAKSEPISVLIFEQAGEQQYFLGTATEQNHANPAQFDIEHIRELMMEGMNSDDYGDGAFSGIEQKL